MYQDDKGNNYRTDTEEQVFWGMRLLKIAFVVLIIAFTAYFVESIIELNMGLEYTAAYPIYDIYNSPKNYIATSIFLAIYGVGFNAAVFVLSFGALFLSRTLPDPVKKELKITGILFIILIPLELIGQIIRISLYSNYSVHRLITITKNVLYTSFAFNVVELLFLVIVVMKLGKELRRMNEMQRGKNGTIVLPGILLAFFIIWLIGGIMFYVVASIEGYPTQLEPVLTAAIYVEGIAQLLYAATMVGVSIALLIKTNKIAISPLAAMNHTTYY